MMMQARAGSGKDADMSPFEAARKLLSLDSRDLHLDSLVIQHGLSSHVNLSLFSPAVLQARAGSGKDADMSPFEAARKLLSLDSRDLHLGQRADLVFQDSDLVPLLIQVIYMHVKEERGMKMEMNKDASRSALGESRCTWGAGCT